MSGSTSFRLPFLARRKHLPALPGQRSGTTYGVIWDAWNMPVKGSCYIVEFERGSQVSIIAYVNESGGAYQVSCPISREPDGEPDFALVPDDGDREGTVFVKCAGSTMRARGRYQGSIEGTMREVREPKTWNTERRLTYRLFMASMFLRYCVLDDTQGPGCVNGSSTDLDSIKLAVPVEVFDGFQSLALPDAIEAALYRIDGSANPSGIECFARRVLREIDVKRLRAISMKVGLSLAYIERVESFYINFDRSSLAGDEVACVLSAEAALNRICRVLNVMGFGLRPVLSSPSEQACSIIDQRVLCSLTGCVESLLAKVSMPNPWARMGTVACEPGGEWDIRTRLATLCESLGCTVRLEYELRCHAAAHVVAIRYTLPTAAMMPASRYDRSLRCWRDVDDAERNAVAREYGSRLALVLGAAAFAASPAIEQCYIEGHDMGRDDHPVRYRFKRPAFIATFAPLARELEMSWLRDGIATERLVGCAVAAIPTVSERACFRAPAHDARRLPPALRELLLADTAAELEVMERPDDPLMKRLSELRRLAPSDSQGAMAGLIALIGEAEASCAAQELMSDVPLQSRFCDNHLGRILLPLFEEDRRVRFARAPDALFLAQSEVCNAFAQAGNYEAALPEARRLLDMATTSMQAHFMLINVLARLERFDEVIEVCTHGLRIAYDRDAIAYLYYRMAFAYWSRGAREIARACYRMVPRGEEMSDMAAEELRALQAEMGVSESLSLAEARGVLDAAGIPVPPVREVTNQIADAAVLLTDNGFFYLASRCVFHMWRMLGSDELGVVQRSLMLQG